MQIHQSHIVLRHIQNGNEEGKKWLSIGDDSSDLVYFGQDALFVSQC